MYDTPLYREFAGLGGMSRLPDRVSILRFRHLLKRHQLAEQFLKTVNEQLNARGFLLKEGTVVEMPLVALLRLVHFRVTLAILVLGRTRRGNQGGIAHAVAPRTFLIDCPVPPPGCCGMA